jgi:hypothetical protein
LKPSAGGDVASEVDKGRPSSHDDGCHTPSSRRGAGHAILALAPLLSRAFHNLTAWLNRRTAARLPLLLTGILLASGRRTVTSWFRATGITDDFRRAYYAVCVVGRKADHLALATLSAVRPCLGGPRARLAGEGHFGRFPRFPRTPGCVATGQPRRVPPRSQPWKHSRPKRHMRRKPRHADGQAWAMNGSAVPARPGSKQGRPAGMLRSLLSLSAQSGGRGGAVAASGPAAPSNREAPATEAT